MKISLDWDDTVTRDPVLWLNFAADAEERGHEIFIVTYRNDNQLDDIYETLQKHGVVFPVIATGGNQKGPYTRMMGFLIDVWIDDMPEVIVAKYGSSMFGEGN